MKYLRYILTNICRLTLAVTFIMSGYVKAVDPLGTQYKINDYLAALSLADLMPEWLTLVCATALPAIEFSLGMCMLFAIRRRLTSKIVMLLMTVMTAITLWIFIADPVKDCGCFGDALTLTNGETLVKNIILTACAAVVTMAPLRMPRLISENNQWIVVNYTLIFILITSIVSLYTLPQFDFRPYHTGADIRKGMEIPEGAEQPEFETTFVMRKDGTTREFTIENYPDSTWEFVDSHTIQTKKGYEPPIHDFSIVLNKTGEDITGSVLSDPGYTFLLIAPHLENADDSNFGNIDRIYEYAQDHDVPFYCLTASSDRGIRRWQDITGAEYDFCTTDETTLKTMIRSNPGLMLIKNGVIIRKWSHNDLPEDEQLTGSLDKIEIGQLPDDSTIGKILK
ncbi:MAG: BT_3928 family protein, partial [Prevotella sp.]